MSEALSHARARLHSAREATRDEVDFTTRRALFDLISAVELLIDVAGTSLDPVARQRRDGRDRDADM